MVLERIVAHKLQFVSWLITFKLNGYRLCVSSSVPRFKESLQYCQSQCVIKEIRTCGNKGGLLIDCFRII